MARDDSEKLQMIRQRMREALIRRVGKCKEEAEGLQNDMAIATERLVEGGYNADISSVRVAAYHINQTELLVLRKVWKMINSIVLDEDHCIGVDDEEED